MLRIAEALNRNRTKGSPKMKTELIHEDIQDLDWHWPCVTFEHLTCGKFKLKGALSSE